MVDEERDIFCTYCGKYHRAVYHRPEFVCKPCRKYIKNRRERLVADLKSGSKLYKDTKTEQRIKQLESNVRFKGAKKLKGYTFSGHIPEPKTEDYYKFVV